MAWQDLLLALVPVVALALVARFAVARRIVQAEALARAAAAADLAAAAERLRGREEQLGAARAELDAARRRIDELASAAAELRARLAESETRLEQERRQSEEKLALLAEAERKLADAFARLAREALAESSDSFLKLAHEAFAGLRAGAQGDLDQRRQAIAALLAPIREQLARYETSIVELERTRQEAYGALREQLGALASSQEGLTRETRNLVTALRRPEVRGSWGEIQLRRAVEFAGMLERVDFAEQETVATEEGRLRPDLVVKLPGGKQVVVDAKAPLDAYLAAVEAADDDERRAALERHARQVRNHLAKLAEKKYWEQFDHAPEFVVLFLPAESFFSAALEHDAGLLEDAFRQSVLIATPATLVALLKSVAYAWRQEALADNARAISDAALELYERLRVFADHLAGVGKGLTNAVAAYNRAVASFEARVLPQGRRFEGLGPAEGRTIVAPVPVETAPRPLATGAEEPSDA